MLLALALLIYGSTAEAAIAAPERPVSVEAFEVAGGRGFVGRARSMIKHTQGTLYATNWVDLKLRPLRRKDRWKAIGIQLGAHQSDDRLKNMLCQNIPSIAGRTYCGSNDSGDGSGSQFMALYAGIHAELITLLDHETRPAHIYVGGGATQVQASRLQRSILPYSSVEFTYKASSAIQARAGVFLSMLHDESLSLAAPSVSVEYRF